jgi:hypothetical protein
MSNFVIHLSIAMGVDPRIVITIGCVEFGLAVIPTVNLIELPLILLLELLLGNLPLSFPLTLQLSLPLQLLDHLFGSRLLPNQHPLYLSVSVDQPILARVSLQLVIIR